MNWCTPIRIPALGLALAAVCLASPRSDAETAAPNSNESLRLFAQEFVPAGVVLNLDSRFSRNWGSDRLLDFDIPDHHYECQVDAQTGQLTFFHQPYSELARNDDVKAEVAAARAFTIKAIGLAAFLTFNHEEDLYSDGNHDREIKFCEYRGGVELPNSVQIAVGSGSTVQYFWYVRDTIPAVWPKAAISSNDAVRIVDSYFRIHEPKFVSSHPLLQGTITAPPAGRICWSVRVTGYWTTDQYWGYPGRYDAVVDARTGEVLPIISAEHALVGHPILLSQPDLPLDVLRKKFESTGGNWPGP